MSDCDKCKVMKLIEDFNFRMLRGDSTSSALEGALISMRDKKEKRTVITCMTPGCNTGIQYTLDDKEVPLYCTKHRTQTGRHAGVRILKRDYP